MDNMVDTLIARYHVFHGLPIFEWSSLQKIAGEFVLHMHDAPCMS